MKGKYFSIILILIIFNCTRPEGGNNLPPVITLDSETSIYTVKVGREITISPSYENVSKNPIYKWIKNDIIICTDSVLTYSSSETGSEYITINVSTRYGEDEEELRIDVLKLDKPEISLAGAENGFTILKDSKITLSPTVSSSLPVSYLWKIDGNEAGTKKDFIFSSSDVKKYQLSLIAVNEDASDTLNFSINVCTSDQIPFRWTFESTTLNMSVGRTIRLLPLDIINAFGAEYTWWIDGVQMQQSSEPLYRFTAEKQGSFIARVRMQNQYLTIEQELTLNVAPSEGTYRRSIAASSSDSCNKVYAFLPAPGQFVNERYVANTMEEACSYAEGRLKQTAYVSLGGFGGYIVVGFDHSIDNDGDYNIAVTGNAFDGSSEPGIIWVMQDENGDGLPNDTWYELKGSEYGQECTVQDYSVTYYRPKSAGLEVLWTDNIGGSGSIDYLGAFHKQDYYYPLWVEEDTYTLRGTRLEARNYDKSGKGTYWVNPSYGWGYADNYSSIDRLTDNDNYNAGPSDNHFKISDAVTFDGKPADLKYVDFIKIQVGLNTKSGWLGEVSTEVFGVKDFNMTK